MDHIEDLAQAVQVIVISGVDLPADWSQKRIEYYRGLELMYSSQSRHFVTEGAELIDGNA
jgi:hypothetical protein